VPLTPSFEEPPLTPEEQLALDDGRPEFKFLPYSTRFLNPNSNRGPDRGGVSTATSGRGGAALAIGPADRPRGRSSTLLGTMGTGGVATGIDRSTMRRSGQLPPARARVITGGPPAGVRVGEQDQDRRVAARKPRIEN
jgi:hypothetical protein